MEKEGWQIAVLSTSYLPAVTVIYRRTAQNH